MKSNTLWMAMLSIAVIGLISVGTSMSKSSSITPIVDQKIDWESDQTRVCVLKLMGYSSSRYGSSYYLLDIHRDGNTLFEFNVEGRKKPSVHLGAPVRSQCINVDGVLYSQHEQVKHQFVESTTIAEKNRLWVADQKLIDQMGMTQG